MRRVVAAAVLVAAIILAPRAGLANCANPLGVEADLLYNSSDRVLQYCDGTNWIGMGMDLAGSGDVTSGLVGWWKLNNGSGATATDSISSNNGTLTGGPTWVTGPYGTAVNFDGSDDYVDAGDINAVEGLGALTNCAWLKRGPGGGAFQHIVDDRDTASGWSFQTGGGAFGTNRDLLANVMNGASTAFGRTSTTPLTAGVWVHACFVYDGSLAANADRLKIYANGVAQTLNFVGTIPAAAIANATPLVIAEPRSDPGNDSYFEGAIDDVRIYNRALSAAEVAAIYTATQVDYKSGLVGWWKLNEGSGTTAIDASGTGNTGTLTAGPTWVSGKYGGAVNFDGVDDVVGTTYNGNPSKITLSAWIKADSFGEGSAGNQAGGILVKGNKYFLILEDDPGPATRMLGFSRKFTGGAWLQGYWNTPTDSISLGKWHHVAVTYDDSSASNDPVMYIDGVAQTVIEEFTPAGTAVTSAENFVIGAFDTGGTLAFDGLIDDARIFDRILSATEIATLYRDASTYCTTAGDVIFNDTTRAMQYCDGTHWISARRVLNGDVTGGIVGWWKLNESGNTNIAADSSGNGLNGTLTNFPADETANWVAGKVNNALDFDGSNDVVLVSPATPINNIFDGGGTVMAWIHPQGWGENSTGRVINKASGTGPTSGYALMLDPGAYAVLEIDFSGNDGGWMTPGNSLALNKWQHVVLVYDASSTSNNPVFYIDGVSQSVAEFDAPSGAFVSDAAQTLRIGDESGGSRAYNGMIDDVRVYNRVLSAGEIAAIHNATRSDYDSGLVGHWKLDDGPGKTTAADSAGTNTGTLANMEPDGDWVTGKLGGALDFDGADDFVNIDGVASSLQSQQQGTISLWSKRDALGTQRWFSVGTNGIDSYLDFRMSTSGLILFALRKNTNTNQIVYDSDNLYAADLNEWHQYAIVSDGGSYRLYRDGQEVTGAVNQQTGTALPGDWVADFATVADRAGIGVFRRDTNTEFFDGLIDDVRIYDRALPPEEIADLYNDTKGCVTPAARRADVIYNADLKWFQFCDGKQWIKME